MHTASTPAPFGAHPGEWEHFAYQLDLRRDLLPVVSNPNATIAPGSTLQSIGKTPSRYDKNRNVVGIGKWTQEIASAGQIAACAKEPDFGICIQTRRARAIDVDIVDPELAAQIAGTIATFVGALPIRQRANSPKFLAAFRLPGEYTKRILKTAHGNIEFLANGQQFIASGTHPSGARYEWAGGLPAEFPELTPQLFEDLWGMLEMLYGIEPSTTLRASQGAKIERRAEDGDDPMVPWLFEHWEVRGEGNDGRLDIRCPFDAEHTTDSGPSSTSYYPAGVGGYSRGHFKCLHAHCAHRTDEEFIAAIGDPTVNAFPDYAEDDKAAALIADLIGTPAPSAAGASQVARGNAPRDPRDDFYAHLQDNKFIFRPTGVLWTAAGVDGHYQTINGTKPSKWLAVNRGVHQLTWWPGKPEIVEGELIASGEVRKAPGRRAYNLYRAPQIEDGNPADIRPWLDHLRTIYPEEWNHLVMWFAHRVQRPGEKLNHALVLGGAQGIGKDSILEPLKRAVGGSNFNEIDPEHALGNFNTFNRAVVLRVNEARDLGNANDRFRLYERFKTIIAAPPDVLRINEKHVSEYPIPNVVGVIYTTNHAVDGLYLPPDDRRHYVAWSTRRKEEFEPGYWGAYWTWLDAGGWRNVATYLRTLSLDDFDPKADPPKTPAFYAIVNAGRDPEDGELQQVLADMGNPDAVTVADIRVRLAHLRAANAMTDNADDWITLEATLSSAGARRKVPHMFERAGYLQVPNANATDRLWVIEGRRQAIYARTSLPNAERFRAARAIADSKSQTAKG
jgi:hypothetical protein